ncbi:mycofactocin biosynthesis peptidyl-dipeptidase MftE, partial [bacterium]|nr:mycofactocin biosynthesis peptidyl-dipeptidase MftE [bacterium]
PEIPPNACVVIPVGSYEQHGPHLPLDTDTQIAVHLCTVAAQDIDCAVIAPPLSITASGEHAGFPGTISIGTEALVAVIVELVRSCDWASGVILAHGHGGNLAAVQRATTLLHSEQRNVANWWPHIQDADAHAGHTETSLMMSICPHLVRMDKLDTGKQFCAAVPTSRPQDSPTTSQYSKTWTRTKSVV